MPKRMILTARVKAGWITEDEAAAEAEAVAEVEGEETEA